MNNDLPHSKTTGDTSLMGWLCHPRTWSASEIAGLLILVCVGLCLLVFPLEPELANLLAIVAYLVLMSSILLVAWRRFFKP